MLEYADLQLCIFNICHPECKHVSNWEMMLTGVLIAIEQQ